jgi:hypothetical protein
LTFIIVLAHRSLPTKCAPRFASIIKPYHGNSANLFTLLVPVYCLFRVSTLRGVGPLSSHVVMISILHSYIHPVLMSQRRSSSNAPMFDSAWKFLPNRGCRLNLEIWEGLFPFRASARVVEPRRSNDEVQHKQSWSTIRFDKVLCHPRTKGKVARKTEKFSSFELSWYPSSCMIKVPFLVSCASHPPS